MLYSLAADSLLLLHLLFILFVVFGGLLVMKWHWLAALQLPAAAWGALIEFYGWTCPLTPLENHFRQAAGGTGYDGGFIEHYLAPLIYPAGLSDDIQLILGGFVVAINLLVYGIIVSRR